MKSIKRILAATIFLTMFFNLLAVPVIGAQEDTANAQNGAKKSGESPKIFINGEEVVFDDVLPYIDNNSRTMVPLRFLNEALEAETSWNDDEQKVTIKKGDVEISLKIGEKTAYKGDEKITLDTAAVLKNDRTMVPLRFIGDSLGVKVEYNEEDKNVYITNEESEKIASGEKKEFVRKLNNDTSEGIEEVNVLDFGADPTGVKESTSSIKQAHNTGKRVYYPNGNYRFNGKNLDFSGGVRFESPDGVIVHNDISDSPVIVFDDFGNLIGLQQNHLESYYCKDLQPMTVGSLVEPPLAESEYKTKADMLVYWYNDFCLESTRLNPVGWTGWYTWEWNYHANGETDMSDPTTYWPERHPLLGFYRGDDPTVLDWQCYWLREYGVKGVIVQTKYLDAWEDVANKENWIYKLFNETKNFNQLEFALMIQMRWFDRNNDNVEDTRKEIRDGWKSAIEKTYLSHDNVYCMEFDGKKYPVIMLFEEGQVSGLCDAYQDGKYATEFLKEISQMFKDNGYGGFVLFSRFMDGRLEPYAEELRDAGVIRYKATYEHSNSTGDTYQKRVDSFAVEGRKDEILHVFSGSNTHSPHPSKWVCPGNTPELFEEMINKVLGFIDQFGMPNIITCYNMGEWSEGAPGIQPNVQDRFGYLDAIKNAIVIDDE